MKKIYLLLLCICTLQVAYAQPLPYKVAVVYAVPDDVPFNPEVLDTLKEMTAEMQGWYQIATGGRTFEMLYPDTVRVYQGQQDRLYYRDNGDWWGSMLTELQTTGAAPIWTPGIITIIWAHGAGWWAGGAQGCGQDCGTVLLGVELLPKFNNPTYSGGTCPGGEGVGGWPCTPQGAFFHEFGHTLGLPHPAEIPETSAVAGHSIMQTHWNYPNFAPPFESPWGLLTRERQIIAQNPFMKANIDIFQSIEEADVVNLPVTGPVPNAAFTYTKIGNEVHFINTSSGATFYYWTFGDGRVSNQVNPTHTFQGPGPFKVTLRASNAVQMMDTASVIIREGNPQVLSFTLVDASKDRDMMTLSDGAILNLKELEKAFDVEKFNIRANTSDHGVVKFELSGIEDKTRIDDVAPYALFGDNRKGDYYSWEPEPGFYTLMATLHAGTKEDMGAPIGPTQIINFRIVRKQIHPEQHIESLTLIDASQDQDIMPLSDGAILNLEELEEAFDAEKFNIRANTSAPVVVKFELSGEEKETRIDDVAPYALFGDNRKGDYYSWEPEPGDYKLKATPFAGTKEDLGEPNGPTLTIHFKVVKEAGTLAQAELEQAARLEPDQLTLYPNPSPDGRVQVQLPGQLQGLVNYTLFSSVSEKLTEGTLDPTNAGNLLEFDFSSHTRPTGLYFLRLEGTNMNQVLRIMRR
ncbi:PKD domain-containing protein [Botryobacter ruber]|uniref:PKD domain-containing protein n=1 Tax=Botryobacter ruber TaxID=2171629 RepID=UPI000E0B4627|nr:PKD domain-containing protein [Botryobacter ruber]